MAKVKKKSVEFKIDAYKYLELSEETISDGIVALPQDYYYLQQQRNLAKKKLALKLQEKQKLNAEIFIAEKSSPAYDRAPSDKYVIAMIHDDDDYMKLKEEIIELEFNWGKLDSIVRAMEVKAKLIQTLASNMRINQ